MNKVSRRLFLASTAAVPFALWFEKNASGARSAVMRRYEARSARGQEMLKIYAEAVAKMRIAPAGDPRNWVFQWYTHAVRGDSTKSAQLSAIYPAQSGANFELAKSMWNTCENHKGIPGRQQFFLPWHRMYVYFLERIVRQVSGNPDFTLPYWNYGVSGANRGVLPEQFRMQNDPNFGSLYIADRNEPANSGQAIDQGKPKNLTTYMLEALGECTYNPVGAKTGFCQNIDANLHGNVHVWVGNTVNMGRVPWAANDPIFWLHHCNIDRLWASWNRAGRQNPNNTAFVDETFTFADENGTRVTGKVGDFLDINALNYTYDRFEPAQGICPTTGAFLALNSDSVTRATLQTGPIQLSTQPVRVNLEPAAAPDDTNTLSFRANVSSLRSNRRLYLIVRNLRTEGQPGVLYDIYLELPENTTAQGRISHYVGSINFFDAEPHVVHDGGGMTGMSHSSMSGGATARVSDKFFSFDITNLARRLRSRNRLDEQATLTIVPSGQPVEDAKPIIGETVLIEQ